MFLGIHYDVTGAALDLLTPESEREFERRAKCISDQYSAIKDNDTGLFLDGKRTNNEDLADHGGLRAAYIAYKMLKGAKKGSVPGFGLYTPDQQFFIGFAEIRFWVLISDLGFKECKARLEMFVQEVTKKG
jgi:predicted metalloendopeptidase